MPIDIKSKKILIIDDFTDFRRMLKKMLLSIGAKYIDEASSGEVALQELMKNTYDVILCDYNLGLDKKNGQQVLEDAKQRGFIGYSSVFIMLTAENTMPRIMGVVEYQPDDYLIKPITSVLLQNRINKVIKKNESLKDIETAVSKKEYLHAISLCNEGVKNNPKNILEYLKIKSNLCITIGHYDEATAVFEQVLSMREIPWAKTGVGKIPFLLGDYLKAKDIFQSVIEQNRTLMEAYDWLAKTMKELGIMEEAQHVLKKAAEISPNYILRHQEIGNISYRIEDYDSAKEAFQTAIDIGKNSCFKSSDEFTGLAKTLIRKDCPDEALSVLDTARNEFEGNNKAMFQTALVEGVIYKEMNREEDAKKAINEATTLLDGLSGEIPVEDTVDLAKACFALGEKEKGMKFIENIVKNHHDDENVINMAQRAFVDAKLEDEGGKVISSSKNEIIKLNNRGVRLVKESKFEEAIEYFDKAASGLSDNKIINTNAAYAHIAYMEENGVNEENLGCASLYLDKVKKIAPTYEKYQKLLYKFEELTTVWNFSNK